MFKSDEQRSHERKLAEISAKSEMLSSIVSDADLSKVVILPKHILKLAFIIGVYYDEKNKLTKIEYFEFDTNNSFGVRATKYISIPENDMSFEDIKAEIKNSSK